MNIKTLLLISIATFATSAFAAAEIQFTPGAKAQSYRKVLIAPARVEFDRDFLVDMRSVRGQGQRLRPEDLRRIEREMGETFHAALEESFRMRGFEITLAPGSDVLSISPTLRGLYVNAPDASTAVMVQHYVREAGRATMVVEGRDAAGAPVFVASERGTTSRTAGFTRASGVSNRFWFDAMFRRWADELAVALASAR